MDLGAINSQTNRYTFPVTKANETLAPLFLSFTGNKKIEGYLRDLHFIIIYKGSDFNVWPLAPVGICYSLPHGGKEKSFSRFYDHYQHALNQDLTKLFLEFSKQKSSTKKQAEQIQYSGFQG